MLKFMLTKILIPLCLVPLIASAQSVTLRWDAPEPTNGVVGYRVIASGTGWAKTNLISGVTNLMTTFTNIPAGKALFSAMSLALDNTESDPSNQVTWTNRAFAPKQLRITSELQGSLTVTGAWHRLALQSVFIDQTNSFSFFRSQTTLEPIPPETIKD